MARDRDGNNNNNNNGNNNSSSNKEKDKDPKDGENTLAWHQRLPIGGAAKAIGIGLLVITGLAILPAMISKAGADLAFGWLPEEYRPMASGACSFMCCCSTCLSVCLAIYMAMSKAG